MCAGGCGKGNKQSKAQLSITKQMKKSQPQKQNQPAKILPFVIKGDKSKTVYFPRIQM